MPQLAHISLGVEHKGVKVQSLKRASPTPNPHVRRASTTPVGTARVNEVVPGLASYSCNSGELTGLREGNGVSQ